MTVDAAVYDLDGSLKSYFGFNEFRANQKEIISLLLEGRDVIAILPTGAGKSLCYQLPAMMLPGIAIVVSPLISLMQDQVVSLNKSGIPAAFLNSSLWQSEVTKLLNNLSDYKLLFVAPERFEDQRFLNQLKDISPSFFAIDEAHCISQWGHSFRPEYRKLSFLKKQFPQCPIIALTATATPEVEKDIIAQLAIHNPKIVKSSFDRPNLTIRVNDKRDADGQLREFLNKHSGESGIIYCATRKSVDATYVTLEHAGYQVGKYHAGMPDSDRASAQHAFLYDEIKLMVATIAFGMGIHKPDIRFIVHMAMPKTIEQYYQEIGRAGRDGLPSECLMLYDGKDVVLYRYFIEQLENMAERRQMETKLNQMFALCSSTTCRRSDLLKYFGEHYPHPVCKNCDNCLDDVELIDGTEIAQKILSCVYRIGQNFGAQMVIDVLRGSKNQKVLNRRFDTLSTYNLMREYAEQELRYYINALVHMSYLKRSEGEYPVLKWTEKSREVTKGNAEIKFRKKTFRESRRVDHLVEKHDTNLFKKLRELRQKLSQEEGIPPYAVFTDRSLMEMAAYFPQNQANFVEINGVGPHKWNKYGATYLEAIQSYCAENRIEKPLVETTHNRMKASLIGSAVETMRLFQEGKSIEEICKIRGFVKSTISQHIADMIVQGAEVDLDSLVPKEKQEAINHVIAQVGSSKLKPIKELLPEDISYDEIRFVTSFYQR